MYSPAVNHAVIQKKRSRIMEMSITRALAELKLLDSRIRKGIGSSVFVDMSQGKKPVTGYESNEQFVRSSKSHIQSVKDLIARRQAIKSAIVKSNAQTEVVISDKKMTVAEAIERKSSIQYERLLVEKLRTEYFNTKTAVEDRNVEVRQRLDALLESHFGKDTSQRVREEDVKAISEPYLGQNEWHTVCPPKTEDIIQELEKELHNFEFEINYILSESNTVTKIVIDD